MTYIILATDPVITKKAEEILIEAHYYTHNNPTDFRVKSGCFDKSLGIIIDTVDKYFRWHTTYDFHTDLEYLKLLGFKVISTDTLARLLKKKKKPYRRLRYNLWV